MDYIIIPIRTVSSAGNGQLSFFEGTHDIPFAIKRIYYISGVPEGNIRGYHAHKFLQQLLFCPYGGIEVTLDDGSKKETVLLNRPDLGIVINPGLWREIRWMRDDSVLCVAASDYYTEADYIRDYSTFLEYRHRLNTEHQG